MYPMEYRWMSVDTPVTKSTMVTDRGSSSNDVLTWKPPDWIHVKIGLVTARSSDERPSRKVNVTTLATNALPVAMVASQPAAGSPSFLPPSSRSAKPTKGSKGMRYAASMSPSALQDVEVVGSGVSPPAED